MLIKSTVCDSFTLKEFERSLRRDKAQKNKKMIEMTTICNENDYSDLESRSEALGWDLSELLDEDKDFRKDILNFIIETGTDFDQICFGCIALAQYYLECVRPDRCGFEDFYIHWIEPVEYHDLMVKAVDSALERAKKRIETSEAENAILTDERSLR